MPFQNNIGIPTIRDFIYDYGICEIGMAPQDLQAEVVGQAVITVTIIAAPGTVPATAAVKGQSLVKATVHS